MSPRPSARRPGRRSRGVQIGLGLFALGLVFIVIDVVPFFDGARNTPLWLNLACLLTPLGFVVALGSALRAGRADQRRALADVADPARIH